MYFKTGDVAGLRIFYREGGDPSKPTIVLLHGFPSSSHQFHDLIPRLADRFHVIAPDYPGMGYSEVPDPTVLRPNFDDVAMAACPPRFGPMFRQDIPLNNGPDFGKRWPRRDAIGSACPRFIARVISA